MPTPREALGHPEYFDRLIPEHHRRYFEPRPPTLWQRLSSLAVWGALLGGGAYAAFRSGMLRRPIARVLAALGEFRGTALHTLAAHLRYAGEPLEDLSRPIWERLSLSAQRLAGPVVDAGLVRRSSAQPTLFERLLAQRARAEEDLREAMVRVAGTVDPNRYARVMNAITEWIRREALLYRPDVEAEMLRTMGLRHARVEELIRRGTIPRTPYIEQMLRQFPELGQRMADPYVFIDEAGRVVDIREFVGSVRNTLRSLESEFGLPFVGFNPFRMFFGSQILGLEEMPLIHVFHPASIQPILTGHIRPLSDLMVYLGGRVFRVTASGLELLDEGYLVPSRRGTIARLVREMAGKAVAEFAEPSTYAPWWEKAAYRLGRILDIGRQDVPPAGVDLRHWGEWTDPLTPLLGGAIQAFLRRARIAPAARYYALEQAFGPDEYLFMRRYRPLRGTPFLDWLGQFTAGRHALEDVTTGTLIPYMAVSRLNAALNRMGLGLSIEHLGSAQQIFLNLMGRRVLPVVAGLFYWQYLNWESENLFGFQPEDVMARVVVGLHADLAKARDVLGITAWAKHARHLIPGLDQIQELPIVGPLLMWDRSYEETLEYYLEGEEPVRRGRYWPFSSTPFTGERVERFVPTWPRRIGSDYEFTQNVLGTPEEYFSHALWPTPRYPLAPLNRLFFDPYFFERRVYFERPYPIAGGGLPELEEFPILGPLLNATLGELIRPSRRMHPEFWQAYEQARQAGAIGAGTLPSVEWTAGMPGGTAVPGAPVGPAVEAIPGEGAGPEAEQSSEGPALPSTVAGVPVAMALTGRGGPGAPGGRTVACITASGMVVPMRMDLDLSDEILHERLQRMSAIAIGLTPVRLEEQGPGAPPTWPVPGIRGRIGRTFYDITEMAGFYGFALTSLTGEYHPPELPTSLELQSYRRAWWALEMGGLGGELSEIARRFIPRPGPVAPVPIRNLQPSWLPTYQSYFLDVHWGDPYLQLPQGEMRLPGAAYEALYNVPEIEALMRIPEIRALVDAGLLNRYELYSPLTRLEILSDIAPWSQEFRRTSALVSQLPLSEADRERAKEARRKARIRRQDMRVYPYRFQTAELTYEPVTIVRWLDNNLVLVREYPGHPIRLAGIHVPSGKDDPTAQKAREFLHRVAGPGTRVLLGYTADEGRKFERTSVYETLRGVLIVGNVNLNRELLRLGLATEREQDWTPAGVHARFSEQEIWFGSWMERLAHLDTPWHTKFWQVRSPLEMYWRRDLYGKRYQAWSAPVRDYLVPTLESYAMRPPPLAILAGAGLGYLFGQSGFGKLVGALAGATLMGALTAYRVGYEALTGERWIPPRRRLEWEINEYLDILRFIRAARLFYRLAEDARRYEGVDVRRLIEALEAQGEQRQREIEALEELKRRIVVAERPLSSDEMAALLRQAGIRVDAQAVQDVRDAVRLINARIREIGARRAARIGPRTAAALAAWRDMQRTMYAYRGGYMGDVLAALPPKDRQYFTYFVQAPERERPEILRVVPPYMRRLLRFLWGQGLEPQVPLEVYFQRRALPPPEWPGWDPSVPWEAVQVAVVRQAGLDPREFGLWEEAEQAARRYPVPVPKLSIDFTERAEDVRRRLVELLGAAGYRDIEVMVRPEGDDIEIDAQILVDRRREAAALIEQTLPALLED